MQTASFTKAGKHRGQGIVQSSNSAFAAGRVQLADALRSPGARRPLGLRARQPPSGGRAGPDAVVRGHRLCVRTDLTTILYTSARFLGTVGNPPQFGNLLPLWDANWNVSCPNIPGSWTKWTFW